MSSFIQNLRERVAAREKKTILFPESGDGRVREAIGVLNDEGLVNAFLSTEENEAALTAAMQKLSSGEVDGVVAGVEHTTADVIRSALKIVGKKDHIQTVSSSFYMAVPPFRGDIEEVLTFADCAVVPEPTSEQLKDIAIASADARAHVVGDEPRVAFLSYSTYGSGGDRPSTERVREAVALMQKERPDLNVIGEVQADAALIPEVAKSKSSNKLQGNANVLIFPSLDAGNIAYKLVAHIAPNVHAIGPVLQGLKKPVSDLSRGATVDDIVLSAIVTAAQVSDS